MNTKKKAIAIYILSLSLLVSGCGSGQVFGPTLTPTPTITATPTPTYTTTPTPTITFTPTFTNTPSPTPTLTPTPRTPLSAENIKQWKIFQTLGGVSGVDIVFTPDGKSIAIANQKKIVFYDTSSLQIQETIISNNPVIGLLFSSNGNVLLAMDNQKKVQRYQMPSGEPMGDPTPLKNVTDFCPQGNVLSDFKGFGDGSNLFCLPDQVASFPSDPSFEGLITMAFNADATLAALGGKDGFELVSLDNGRRGETKWVTPQGFIFGSAAAFSPDGRVIALGSWYDGLVCLLNANTGEKLATYPIGGRLESMDYSSDGNLLAVVSNTEAKVIQLESGQASEIGGVSPGAVNDMAFSPDGRYLLTVNDVSQFILWNIVDGSLIFQWQGKPCNIDDINFHWLCYMEPDGVAFSPDGKLFALGDNGSVQIIDFSTGEILHKFEVGQVLNLAFSPDGNQIAVSTLDIKKGLQKLPDGVQLWDIASNKLMQTFPVKPCTDSNVLYNCTNSLSFTPDGQLLITPGGKSITLWDLSTGQQTQNWFDAKMSPYTMTLSSDGSLLIAEGGGVIKLWTVNEHEIAPNAYAIIPCSCWITLDTSGKLIASASTEKDIFILTFWNVKDQRQLGSFDIKIADNSSFSGNPIAFSPIGDILAISINSSVYFYAVQP